MTFETDQHWPEGLVKMFEHIKRNPTFLVGAISKLLYYIFPAFKFYVRPSSTADRSNPLPFLVVCTSDGNPVLFVGVRDAGWADRADLRLRADEEMRKEFDHLMVDCPIPRLYGLSCLGQSLCVYRGTKDTCMLEPPPTPRPDRSDALEPSFLADQWNLDIMSDKAFATIKKIIAEINREVPPVSV
jgi:hypothetical protein